ncbi:TetR/AcrR family transcriptional regulator [Pseudomonas putida]|uniref:TetR/AcrR family transcriptional regulator n=1 Tax=Pseudomonas putida TaxID=303 RepID=A0A3M8TT81_PSEPU|nr:TetR/AcrR family transcriptional regulator [Pseudomonas putida]
MNRAIHPAALSEEECLIASVETAGSRFEEIRNKALELFAERGFAKVGMRELAQHLGMGPGSIYHHFASKEQLLFEAIEELYEDILEAAAITKYVAGDGFQALLYAHVDLHEHRRICFLLSEQEFRYLAPKHRQLILLMRRRYEDILLHRLIDKRAQPVTPVLRATVRGIVAWLNNISAWMNLDELEPCERCEVVDNFVKAALAAAFQQEISDKKLPVEVGRVYR